MSIEYPCPGCSHRLRVPQPAAGQQARCPACGQLSDVPLSTADALGMADTSFAPNAATGTSRTASELAAADNPFQAPQEVEVTAAASSATPPERVGAPATALMLAGGITFFLTATLLALDPTRIVLRPNFFGPENSKVVYLLALVRASVMVLGGWHMKQLRYYPLAIAAATLAIIPWFWSCCLIDQAVGIAALMVLSDARVRRGFR